MVDRPDFKVILVYNWLPKCNSIIILFYSNCNFSIPNVKASLDNMSLLLLEITKGGYNTMVYMCVFISMYFIIILIQEYIQSNYISQGEMSNK